MSRQDSRAREEHAFHLRAVGRTYEEIAEVCGFGSRSAAHSAVQRYEKRQPAPNAEGVRRMSDEGLRLVSSVLFERFADAKVREDNKDIVMLSKEIREVGAERSKLAGAYAPKQSELTVNVRQEAVAVIDKSEADLLAIVARNDNVIEGEVVEL